jgi:hypothetical protein
MQILGKVLLLIVLACYVSAKSKTVKDTVVDGATHLKDNVVDGVKTGAKLATDAGE